MSLAFTGSHGGPSRSITEPAETAKFCNDVWFKCSGIRSLDVLDVTVCTFFFSRVVCEGKLLR